MGYTISFRGELPVELRRIFSLVIGERWGLWTSRGGERRVEKTELGYELTPRHRLRQLEPSLFFKGHTTSLLASVTEKELVSELRGGMVHIYTPQYGRGGGRKDKREGGRVKQ